MRPNEEPAAGWYMMTVVGVDRPGIVARLSDALYRGGCNLGEASMARLGGNFTIMLMVQGGAGIDALRELVAPVIEELGLHLHVDVIQAHLHEHPEPNVQVTVYGADQPGIVARVTGVLAAAGLNVLDLHSEVGGSAERPIYIMIIDGHADAPIADLERALAPLRTGGIEVRLTALDTLIG